MPKKPKLPTLDELPGLNLADMQRGLSLLAQNATGNEEKRELYLALMRLKMKRMTNKECASAFQVSERTITNYLADPLYHETVTNFQAESKQNAQLLVSEMAYTALSTMQDLMNPRKTNSEYVRYSAARTVGEWLGLNVPPEEKRSSAQDEVVAFLAKLEQEQPRIQVNAIQVNVSPSSANAPEEAASGSGQIVESLAAPPPKETLLLEAPSVEAFPLVGPGGKLPEGW